MKTLLFIVSITIIIAILLVIYGCFVVASRISREEEKKDPFRIIYRSNTIQFDEMGYPLRLCIVAGNGRINPEQVWLDTLEEDGDVVLKFKKMECEME